MKEQNKPAQAQDRRSSKSTRKRPDATPESLRLQVYLARSGVASRRAAETLIQAGRVRVNGATVTQMGTIVGPEDVVEFDGRPVKPNRAKVYIALHKPSGYVSTVSDPQGRPVVIDLIPKTVADRLYPIGRLDLLSTGLLLCTNDGELAAHVMHPSSSIEKEYVVETDAPIPEECLRQFKRGVTVDGVTYKLSRYQMRTPRRVHLVLHEGKNRELRRVFAFWGLEPRRVHRVRIADVQIGKLPPGGYRNLSQAEIASLTRSSPRGRSAQPPAEKRRRR